MSKVKNKKPDIKYSYPVDEVEKSNLFKTLKSKYIIEWTTGKDLKIICTIWSDNLLRAKGISKDSFYEALELASKEIQWE